MFIVYWLIEKIKKKSKKKGLSYIPFMRLSVSTLEIGLYAYNVMEHLILFSSFIIFKKMRCNVLWCNYMYIYVLWCANRRNKHQVNVSKKQFSLGFKHLQGVESLWSPSYNSLNTESTFSFASFWYVLFIFSGI